MRNHFIWALGSLLLISCISVKVPFEASSKAGNLQYQSPDAQFTLFSSDTADRAWISSKTGNTLSFLSECKKNLDKIESVALDTIKAVENVEVISRNNTKIDDLNAYEVIAVGTVEQAPVKIAVTTLTNGACNITLSYGGLKKNFETELVHYEKFKQGFRIQ